MTVSSNPYDPPNAVSITFPKRRLPANAILRNAAAWTVGLLTFCTIDVIYVHVGPSATAWAELLFLPLFPLAMFWANKDLFRGKVSGAQRWFAVVAVTLLVVLTSGYVLVTLGVWFHFAIGGTL
jgi:hypothetical protein